MVARPDLSGSSAAAPAQPEAGQPVRWFVQVVNQGTVAARNVRVTDVLPLEFVENVVVDGGVLQGDRATANFEEVPPGGAVGFAIEAVVRQGIPDGTVVLNQATIVADDAEPVRRMIQQQMPWMMQQPLLCDRACCHSEHRH